MNDQPNNNQRFTRQPQGAGTGVVIDQAASPTLTASRLVEALNPVQEFREFEIIFNSKERNELLINMMEKMEATPAEIQEVRSAMKYEMGVLGEVHHPLLEALNTQLFLGKLRQSNFRAVLDDFKAFHAEASRLQDASIDRFGKEVSDKFNGVVDRAESFLTQILTELVEIEKLPSRFGTNGDISAQLVSVLNDGVASGTNLQADAIASRMDAWLNAHKQSFEAMNKAIYDELLKLKTVLDEVRAIKVEDLAALISVGIKAEIEEDKRLYREELEQSRKESKVMLADYAKGINWTERFKLLSISMAGGFVGMAAMFYCYVHRFITL